MKFAFIHKSYGRPGGTEGVMRGLASGLSSRGHTVELFVAENTVAKTPYRRLIGRRAAGLSSLALLVTAWLQLRIHARNMRYITLERRNLLLLLKQLFFHLCERFSL